MCKAAHTCELQGQSPPLSSYMTLGKSLHLSEPQFPGEAAGLVMRITSGLVCEGRGTVWHAVSIQENASCGHVLIHRGGGEKPPGFGCILLSLPEV